MIDRDLEQVKPAGAHGGEEIGSHCTDGGQVSRAPAEIVGAGPISEAKKHANRHPSGRCVRGGTEQPRQTTLEALKESRSSSIPGDPRAWLPERKIFNSLDIALVMIVKV